MSASTTPPVALPAKPLTPMETNLFVQLVISYPDGRVVGVLGQSSNALAQSIRSAARLDGFPIEHPQDESLFPAGQEIYRASREYVLSLLGMFTTLSWKEISGLHRLLPETGIFTFVISS
jgi:hypothetical protein